MGFGVGNGEVKNGGGVFHFGEGFAGGVGGDGDVVPGEGFSDAGAERFGDGFFGGKAAGDVWRGVFVFCKILPLIVCEEFFEKGVTILFRSIAEFFRFR